MPNRLLNPNELRGYTQENPYNVPFGGTTQPAFLDRVNNPQNYPWINNGDGSRSTHRMAAEIDEDGLFGPPGKWYVFPTIVTKPDGQLHRFNDSREAMDYNVRTGNAIEFDDGQEAIDYSINYKDGTPLAAPFGTDQFRIDDRQEIVNERAPVNAIENLTPAQRQEFLAAIAPQRPGESFRVPGIPEQAMTPVSPNLRDRVQMFASDAFGSDPVGRRRQGTLMDAADLLDPGFMLAGDARRAFGQGDTIGGVVQGGLSALGVIPGVGPIAKGAGKAARKMRSVRGSQRQKFPGIYKEPGQLVEEANAMVAPESGAMQRLFGADRQDLYDIASTRAGNQPVQLGGMPKNPKGTAHAGNVTESRNTRRLVNALEANRGTPLEQGMTGWYVMDPAYQRLVELVGPEQAAIEYHRLNTFMGLQSPQSDVLTEIKRGTAANWLNKSGRFDDFMNYGGIAASARKGMPGYPEDMLPVPGHTGHRTSAGVPTRKFVETGSANQTSPKVPAYIQASSVPEIGFQTTMPVGDAHFSRGIGLTDVRPEKKTDMYSSWSMPEAVELAPWFRESVANPAGYEAVSGQANLWGLLGPQTGVDTAIGAPKLELLSQLIMDTSKRLKVSPEEARDLVLLGKTHAGFALPGALGALGVGAFGAAGASQAYQNRER
jgi:hypothetical protein